VSLIQAYSYCADSTYTDRNHLYQSVTYFRDADFLSGKLFKDTINNSLRFFHQYNPAINQENPYKYLGNLGTAYQSMVYSNDHRTGIFTGLFDYELYQTTNASIRYFNARKRYSDLRYVLGAHLEQIFNLTHSQNITKNINAAINFQRISSDGAYTNLSAEYGNVSLSVNGRSANNRYSILSNLIYNRADLGQNGGLQHDPLFESSSNTDGLLYPVRIKDGHTQNKTKSIYIKQQYNFGFIKEKRITDSTSTKTFQPSWGLSHSILLEDKSYTYREGGQYPVSRPNNYIKNQTNDSIFNRKLENRIGIYTNENQKGNPETLRKVNMYLLASHQVLLYKQRTGNSFNDIPLLDTFLTAGLVKGAIFNASANSINWHLDGTYNLYGSNKKDYLFQGMIKLKPDAGSLAYLQLKGAHQIKSPAFIFNKYNSNTLIWNNNFSKTALSDIALAVVHPKYLFNISFGYSFIKNYLYFGMDTMPQQQFHTFSINTISVNKDFRLGKFYSANRFIYQKVQKAGTSVINLPQYLTINSFFYEDKFYENALVAQIGFDLRFNSKYYADAYMPATGQFFVQNNTLTGNQGYLDIFINFQIKTARVFLKMENVNAPTTGYSSNMVPNYPIPGRVFKFGISWQFYD
jgi:hypothetical protein